MPFIILYLFVRSVRRPAYFSTLKERWGGLPSSYGQTGGGGIWLHAVSVGEVMSLMELARRLRAEWPAIPLFLSVSTLAGRGVADEKLGSLVDGVFYAPLDFVFVVRRVLRKLSPSVVVVAETEIWPNLFREVKRAGCGLIVINGRISDEAMPRYLKWRWFFRHALLWPDAILAQNAGMRERFLSIGAPAEKVSVGGNLKYDFQPGSPPAVVEALLERLRPDSVWIAASTMPPDEDDIVIQTFRGLAPLHPGLLLVLAPRKPERFDLVAGKLADAGLSFVRRSALEGSALKLPGVLLLDSIGELSGLFAHADVVFMGGTIAPCGGHNILEPAMFGKAIVVGPHMENFQQIAEAFRAAGAMVEIGSETELGSVMDGLLRDGERAREIGLRAKACSESQRGATGTALSRILELRAEAAPQIYPALPVRGLFGVWHGGSAVARRVQTARRVRLRAPVISVGNLTMGGSGKTPMALYLAGKLSKPAILTRGYRRQGSGNLILAAGENAPWTDTGDEAQIFLRSGLAAVGIGADRAEVGRLMEERFAVEHFVLDDGFQHWRLDRDVDIVLVDSLDPFRGDRLRESLSGLSRADVFVITRSDGSRPGIERVLRKYNSRAEIFYSKVRAECWIEGATGRRVELRDPELKSAVAFCGLANPGSFWGSLAEIGLRVRERVAFPDHTRYDRATIAGLLAKHRVLATTEKDWINLGEDAPAGIYWLKIGVEVDDGLVRFVRERTAHGAD